MESKSLKVIQVFCKVLRILTMIGFIGGIVGASMCLIGIIFYALFGTSSLVLGSLDIHGPFEEIFDMVTGRAGVYAALVCTMIACAGAIVPSLFATKYFKHELEAGTPFTFDGSKELLVLGIVTASVAVGCSIINGIIVGIASVVETYPIDLGIEYGGSVVAGVLCIGISFLCKYGAEIRAQIKE